MLEDLRKQLRQYGLDLEHMDKLRCPICGHFFTGLPLLLKHMLTHLDSENRIFIAAFINFGRQLIKDGVKTLEEWDKKWRETFDISQALEF